MSRSDPTLHEVARAARVSIATVSRVIHGGAGVSTALQERVHAAIQELGYRPSHSGRALVNRRHGALGIVFPGLYGPYYSEVIHGIESVAVRNSMAVMILGTHLLHASTEHVLSLSDRTDGLAILGGSVPNDAIERLASRGRPLVLMAQHQILDLPTVRVDNSSSSHDLTTHLLADHGLERLEFLGNPAGSPDVEDRWQGFVDAHTALDISPPDAPIPEALEVSHGHRAGLEILSGHDRPDGIVCANDELALGVLSAARSLSVDVPGDVAVTGWDDIALATHAHPPLTTVHQPARELGASTATMLVDRINAGRTACDGELVELETTPIYRRSCGCESTVHARAAPNQSAHRPL
ncbi:MAG TPA: LacI family DNA-binding transcriptional regulator [Thermomicrobiales bacterium]|nr:LacI family DNA-binding transcriptional regulator [Thermomicrobiales bacterium]